MRFKRGIFLTPVLLGYDHDENGNLVVNESEAATIRIIFFSYMYGYTTGQIADALTELGRNTKKGNTYWTSGSVYQVLTNERYCGDLLARKTFTPNYLDHKSKKNRHDRNQYRQKNHHQGIVSREDFFAVQKMIRNAKYGNKGYYPELKVIKNGILAGYVTVHPKWAAFTEDDYYLASEKVTEGVAKIPSNPALLNIEKGSVDLSGYELVRRAFLSTFGQIEVTFYSDHFIFNNTAIHRMPDVNKIEILVMPHKRLMAIRPSEEKSRYGMIWSRMKEGQPQPSVISGRAYLSTLYRLFGWRSGSQYKVAGVFVQNMDERFLLFDMSEAIRIVMVEPDGQTGENTGMKKRAKREKEYPEGWQDSFGEKYYSTRLKNNMLKNEVEMSGKSEDMVCSLRDEGVTSAEEAAKQMESIIKEIVDGNV